MNSPASSSCSILTKCSSEASCIRKKTVVSDLMIKTCIRKKEKRNKNNIIIILISVAIIRRHVLYYQNVQTMLTALKNSLIAKNLYRIVQRIAKVVN